MDEIKRLSSLKSKYQSKEKARWGIKPKIQPKIAYIKSNKIVMDSLTKELLSDLPG